MIHPQIKDEFSRLKTVVLGTAESFGGEPGLEEAYDPKSKEHIRKGTFPVEADLIPELESFAEVLKKYDVEVLRPKVLKDYNQIFSRDIGFVIDDKLIISNVIEDRSREIDALEYILNRIPQDQVIEIPDGARIEGGDIMPVKDMIFIGYSEPEDFKKYKVSRTNVRGVESIRELFPERKIKSFELNKSDVEPRDNALHLDCCFQPLGLGHAVVYPGGFKNSEDVDYIRSFFGEEMIIEIGREEMYEMQSNLFSIAPNVVVSERSFIGLNAKLRSLGYTVEEVKYTETAKMEGLLRCSTFPLVREY